MIDPTRQRILRSTTASLSWQGQDSNGEIADPGVVTVGVTRSDGTTLVTAGTATVGSGTVARTVALTVAQTALTDVLTATWSAGGNVLAVTEHEIVGGFLFSLAKLRSTETALADPSTITDAELLTIRCEVESSFESWTNLSMVPRFAVVDVYGSGSCHLLTGKFFVRSVRWARYWTSDTTSTLLTSTELLNISVTSYGALARSAGWYGRWQVGIEYGLSAPPADGKRMALLYARIAATRSVRGVSANASSYTTPDGQTVSYDPDVEPTNYKIINEFLRRQDVDHRMPGLA